MSVDDPNSNSNPNAIMQMKLEALDDEQSAALLRDAVPNPVDEPAVAQDLSCLSMDLDFDDDSSSSDSEDDPSLPIKPEPMEGILPPTADSGTAFRPKPIVLRDDSDASSDSDDDYSLSSSSSSSSDSDADEVQEVKPVVEVRGPVKPLDMEDGDFDRLVKSIRSERGGSGDNSINSGGMLAREWDFVVSENVGPRPRKKEARNSYGPALSAHIQTLLGSANQAFVDGDLASATQLMLEVIRIEPRVPSAWAVLAQCYDEQKQLAKGLQLRIMGAHLRQDSDEWDRLARQSKAMGYSQQALYCWQKGFYCEKGKSKEYVAALWDCAMLAGEVDDPRTARFAFMGILTRYPHDLYIISLLRPILITLSDLQTLVNLYNAAFAHYRALYPSGSGPSIVNSSEDIKPHAQEPVPGGGFAEMEVLVLADLFNALGEHERAVEALRVGMRWLQGRDAENWWDLCTDDREYDPAPSVTCTTDPVPRVLDAINDIEAGFNALDVNARHRLAVARLKMGDIDEGQIHAGIILAEDILDYAPLFSELADAYFDIEMWGDAREVYERLGSCETTSSVHVIARTAMCMRAMGDLRQAAEVFEAVRHIPDAPMSNETKMELAEIYEAIDEPRKALDLVYEVMDSRRRRPRSVGPSSGNPEDDAAHPPALIHDKAKPAQPKTYSQMKRLNLPSHKAPKLSMAELRALEDGKEREARAGYKRVKELWQGMKAELVALGQQDGAEPRMEMPLTEEWLRHAKALVEMFRETRRLFSTSRVYRGMFPVRRNQKRLRADAEQEEEENKMVDRLQLDLAHQARAQSTSQRQTRVNARYEISDEFRGIKCDEWLELFFQYAVVLTRRNEYDEAEEVLRHLLVSSVYRAQGHQDRIKVMLVAIASSVGRYPTIVENLRKLHTTYQFNNEPLRLLAAGLSRTHSGTSMSGHGTATELGMSAIKGADAWLGMPLQKYLHREMVVAGKAAKLNVGKGASAKEAGELVWNGPLRRWRLPAVGKTAVGDEEQASEDEVIEVLLAEKQPNGNEGKPKQQQQQQQHERLPAVAQAPNPVLPAMYGQMMMLAKSYQSAIYYLLMAYDMPGDVGSSDPLIALSLVAASLGRASQRQCDNRHQLVAQAMAFLDKYRQCRRVASGDGFGRESEIEYNVGRTFHALGLYSHAVRHYERAVAAAEADPENPSSCAAEAAHNMVLILVATGARQRAAALVKRWLSV
uniref:TPR-like protein n=1 Tax=Mycena chlorophos TaxID=658473 RepID=A0ABQ0M1E2_MYCCL|nr:TPR-like protein [Mycena chlorophos]